MNKRNHRIFSFQYRFCLNVAISCFDPQVAVCDIDVNEGEKLVEILTSDYGKDRVIFCQCDVTDYSQFEGTWEDIQSIVLQQFASTR